MNVDDLKDLDDETRKEIEELQKVTRESDGNESFATSQADIALILSNLGYTEQALEIWKSITHKDSNSNYARAQFNIGTIFYNKNNSNKALEVWRNINIDHDEEIYQNAQFRIGKNIIKSNDIKDIEEAKACFKNAKNKFPYEVKCGLGICEILLNNTTKDIGKQLIEIFDDITNALSLLKININSIAKLQLQAERKLAHYTSTDVGNLLLKKEQPSLFRLNTINNVNDPSEGQLLECCLKNELKQVFHTLDFDDKYHAFIGCFTFNHDSLNQFRLYGKKDNKEASGISLVFNKEFFKKINGPEGLLFIATDNELISDGKDSEKIDKERESELNTISLQPVMRCVYIDPESGFIHLAQRNKITFYREFADYQNQADKEWKKYQTYIIDKTKAFEKLFNSLKEHYQRVIKDISQLSESYQFEINSLLDNILLPLKYLIKHVAFQEEQECRIIYITALDSPEVQIDFGNFLYVDYAPVADLNLDKIYIAPAAIHYRPYLAKLLCGTNIKIDLSNNPYRQT